MSASSTGARHSYYFGVGVLLLALGTACSPTAMQLSQPTGDLLGKTKPQVEKKVEPDGEKEPKGWFAYSDALRVRYLEGKVVSLKAVVPDDMNCKEAARWMGFPQASAPVLKRDLCVWPQNNPGHVLGKGVFGSLRIKSRVFTVSRVQ